MVAPLEFLWREWRLGEGRFRGLGQASKPRPIEFPTRIPLIWWTRLAAFLLKRRLTREANLLGFWRTQVAFGVAWTGQNPYDVCSKIVRSGGNAVWVQNIAEQRSRHQEWRAAANFYNLRLCIWEWGTTVGSAEDAINLFQADGFLVNVEHAPGSWGTYCDTLRAKFPYLPLAVWTNFWGAGANKDGYSLEDSAPFVRNKFMCVTEAYIVNEQGPQPTMNPFTLDWTARVKLGYPETIPSYGIYRTSPDTYDVFMEAFPGYAWYLYEYYP